MIFRYIDMRNIPLASRSEREEKVGETENAD
jgi:hypothetical protein